MFYPSTLYNKTVTAISLTTPHGSFGEMRRLHVRMQRNGAIDYEGIANVPMLGKRKGCVNFLEFDRLASLIETSGVLGNDESPSLHCSAGSTEIEVELTDGRRQAIEEFVHSIAPIHWAVSRLLHLLLDEAEWGDDKYAQSQNSYAEYLRGM